MFFSYIFTNVGILGASKPLRSPPLVFMDILAPSLPPDRESRTLSAFAAALNGFSMCVVCKTPIRAPHKRRHVTPPGPICMYVNQRRGAGSTPYI